MKGLSTSLLRRKLQLRKLRRKHLFDHGYLQIPFDIIFRNLHTLGDIVTATEEHRLRLTGKHIVAALYRCV